MTLSAHRSTKAPRRVPHRGPWRRPKWLTRGLGRAASAVRSGFERALALAGGRARTRVENGLVRAPDAAAVARIISSARDQQQGEDRRGDGGGASPAVVDAGGAESAGAQNIQANVRERAGEAADAGEALSDGGAAGGEDGGVPQAVAPSPDRPQRAEPHQRAPLQPIQAERPLGARSVDGDVVGSIDEEAGLTGERDQRSTGKDERAGEADPETAGGGEVDEDVDFTHSLVGGEDVEERTYDASAARSERERGAKQQRSSPGESRTGPQTRSKSQNRPAEGAPNDSEKDDEGMDVEESDSLEDGDGSGVPNGADSGGGPGADSPAEQERVESRSHGEGVDGTVGVSLPGGVDDVNVDGARTSSNLRRSRRLKQPEGRLPQANVEIATGKRKREQVQSQVRRRIGDVGSTVWKEFHAGWYEGRVTDIGLGAIRRVVYTDGDSEDLSFAQLRTLAALAKKRKLDTVVGNGNLLAVDRGASSKSSKSSSSGKHSREYFLGLTSPLFRDEGIGMNREWRSPLEQPPMKCLAGSDVAEDGEGVVDERAEQLGPLIADKESLSGGGPGADSPAEQRRSAEGVEGMDVEDSSSLEDGDFSGGSGEMDQAPNGSSEGDASVPAEKCWCDICQEICLFRPNRLAPCGNCNRVVCTACSVESAGGGELLCTHCIGDNEDEVDEVDEVDEDSTGEGDEDDAFTLLIESSKSEYSRITWKSEKLAWNGKIKFKELNKGKVLTTSSVYAFAATAALAVDVNIVTLGWTQGGGKNNRVLRPTNYVSLLAFAGDFLEQREQIRGSPEFRAKFADLVRPDLALAGGDETELVAGALELVLEDLNRKLWPANRDALQTTVSNLEEIIAALRDCNTLEEYDGPEFHWNDLPELQLEEIQLEKQNGMIRSKSRAVALYFDEKRGNGSYGVRRVLRAHWRDTPEQLAKRMQEGDTHAAKCLYEMLRMDYADFEVPEEYKGNPQELPLEKMKACSLEYLHEKGIVKRRYIPRFLLPSDQIEDITDVNARQCEIDSFWEEVTPALLAQQDRIEKQLKEMQEMPTIKDRRVKELRSVLEKARVVECFEWLESCQRANPPAETLADFEKELRRRLKSIGLGSVSIACLGMPTEDEYSNKKNEGQRRNAVGIVKDRVAKMLDCNGECPHPRCNRKLLDYDHKACSKGFTGDHTLHDEGKNGNPCKLAQTTDGRYCRELAEKGVLNTCDFHHDPGDVHRSEELDPLKSVRLLPVDSAERDSHRTADEILKKGSDSLLTFSVFVLDMDRRGCVSPSNCCDMNSLRTTVDAHFSKPGNIMLVDESMLRTASQWNVDFDTTRSAHFKAILKNLLMRQSNVCYGADKLVNVEAEARAQAGDDLAEDDYVCKRGDFDIRNLPAAELSGIHGDHFGKKKNCNPSDLVLKSIVELFDEHFLFRYTCCFCHSIRTWHQNRNGKNAKPCYHTG